MRIDGNGIGPLDPFKQRPVFIYQDGGTSPAGINMKMGTCSTGNISNLLAAPVELEKAIELFKECGADGWVDKTEKALFSLSN